AGLLLAMCCDYRIVHKDNKSLYFVPAVSLGLHYTPGMIELIKSKVACNTARDMLCYSTRYNAQQALQAGILDYLISNTEAHHQPLVAAINLITVIVIITTRHVLCYYCYYQENIIVRPFNKESMGKVKRGMYDTVIKNLIHHDDDDDDDDDDAMGINRLLSRPRSSFIAIRTPLSEYYYNYYEGLFYHSMRLIHILISPEYYITSTIIQQQHHHRG
ncbi:hypothetical protein FOZ63_012208, partial [Perkinsus olseni]